MVEKPPKQRVVKMTRPPKAAVDAAGYYRKEKYMDYATSNPDVGSEDVKVALNAEYEALDAEAKAPYEAKEAEDAERFAAESAGWEAFNAKAKGGGGKKDKGSSSLSKKQKTEKKAESAEAEKDDEGDDNDDDDE